MSRPRPVLPQKTYLVTRRCTQRQFLLVPSGDLNRLALYCLAYAASKFSVRIHAFCFLSNHYHLVLTDVLGNLPQFMHWLNLTLTRALNSRYGRWENLWASGTYNRVELLDPQDLFAKVLYTLANPVAAGLVSEGTQWPGLRSDTLRDGAQRILARRPDFYFPKNGPLPETVELVLEADPAMVDSGDGAGCHQLHEAVLEKEAEIRAEFHRQGRGFLGRQGVLRQSRNDSPTSREPRRKLKPQVAAREKERRILRLRALVEFIKAYRVALKRFAEKARDVIFPAGTYWMRIHCGVACHDPAPG